MEFPAKTDGEDELFDNSNVRIAIVGVGGGGCNTVNRIMSKGITSARTVAINTDAVHLKVTNAHKRCLIGRSITRGLGAGGYPEVARNAAETDKALIEQALGQNEVVFICAGMGGGTGTGAAPVVAKVAKESGALTVGIVTFPFMLERVRIKTAYAGIQELLKYVDSLIVIDNNKLATYMPNAQINAAFDFADAVTARALRGIADTIMLPSLINMDYADLRSVMENKGIAMISVGEGRGTDRVSQAVHSTISHPLIDVDLVGAKGALIHISGPEDLTLGEATEIGEKITENFDSRAEVKLGARINPESQNGIFVCAIVTGIKTPKIFEGKIDVSQFNLNGQKSLGPGIGVASKGYQTASEIEWL
ncbi:MAG: cell division protein FtsZ [Candidatus Anstonellales archaeon]